MSNLIAPAFAFMLQAAENVPESRFDDIKQGIVNPDLSKFLVIGALLFMIFIACARYLIDAGKANAIAGQVFTVFIIVVAAAEAAIGLGIVIALYRNKETILIDEIDLLKW